MATETWRAQNSFTGGVITEKMFGRVELEQYKDSVSKLLNFKVQPHGGITRRSGTRYVCEVKDSTKDVRVIPFEFSADDSYAIEVGPLYFRFIKVGVQVMDGANIVELAHPYLEAELFQLKFVQSADVMWIVHENHRPRKLIRYSDTEWYLDPIVFVDGPYFPINGTKVTLISSAATGTATVTAANGAAISGCVADAAGILVTTSSDHSLTSGDIATISSVVGTTEANGTHTVTVVSPKTFTIPVTFVNAYASGGTITPSIFASTDVGRLLRIWHTADAKWGWGEITAFTNSYTVIAEIVENKFPTATTTSWRLGKFSETTGWPSAVTLYETRLAFAGAPNGKQDVDFSQTDNFTFFQSAADETLLATDALGWSLYSASVDNVCWLSSTRGGLAIGTSGGAWIMTGSGGKDDPLTPSSVNAKKHTAVGSDPYIPAVPIDNAVVFVDKAGRRVYEFAYLWEDDSYRSPDLTILADHLFTDTNIVDVDVQGTRKIYWVIAADGNLYGLTYMRAESIVAWHKHQTDGEFKSICAITESRDEIPYFVIKRNIDGSDVQYIEYMQKDWETTDILDAYYLDSGIVFTNSPASTTVSGLGHLEGETVYALADGKVMTGLTVTSGEVTLPVAALGGYVGLNFVSDVETLPIETTNLRSGTTIGREKDLGKVAVRITKSYGCKLGRTFDSLEEVQFNEVLVFGAAPTLFSGEKAVDKIEGQPETDVRVCLRQDLPLPLSVSSLVTKLFITED